MHKLIRLKPLCRKLGGVSPSTVWRRVADGTLPKNIKIGGLAAWDEDEVDDRLDVKLAERGAPNVV